MKGVEIRKPEQLNNVTSLIIPGGESTTMAKLAEYHNLVGLLYLFFLFVCFFASILCIFYSCVLIIWVGRISVFFECCATLCANCLLTHLECMSFL